MTEEVVWLSGISERGSPGGSDGKESACNAGDPGLIPGSGRSLGGGNGNPLQYSCLGNTMNRGAWKATVLGVAKSQTQLKNLAQLSLFCLVFKLINNHVLNF